MSLTIPALSAQTIVPTQGVGKGPASAAVATPATRELFRQYCGKCHGADGTGSAVHGALPEIPNFTDGSWQGRRGDAQLLASILDGKGSDMVGFRRKISQKQAAELVAYIRAFAPGTKTPPVQQTPNSAKHFDDEFTRLQKERDELQRQFQELRLEASEAQRQATVRAGALVSTYPDIERLRRLFQQHCAKCHGADGTGSPARARLGKIPDFTEWSWQQHRSDARLRTSILDGKGKDMPAWRRKIDEDQARGLVEYIRALCPTATLNGDPK
jgi:mono/diheme cytochrome c family protein